MSTSPENAALLAAAQTATAEDRAHQNERDAKSLAHLQSEQSQRPTTDALLALLPVIDAKLDAIQQSIADIKSHLDRPSTWA